MRCSCLRSLAPIADGALCACASFPPHHAPPVCDFILRRDRLVIFPIAPFRAITTSVSLLRRSERYHAVLFRLRPQPLIFDQPRLSMLPYAQETGAPRGLRVDGLLAISSTPHSLIVSMPHGVFGFWSGEMWRRTARVSGGSQNGAMAQRRFEIGDAQVHAAEFSWRWRERRHRRCPVDSESALTTAQVVEACAEALRQRQCRARRAKPRGAPILPLSPALHRRKVGLAARRS